jgi:hypothetical protein
MFCQISLNVRALWPKFWSDWQHCSACHMALCVCMLKGTKNYFPGKSHSSKSHLCNMFKWDSGLRWQLKTSECHSKRGRGNGLTNQNPPLALPTPSHIPLTWHSRTEFVTSGKQLPPSSSTTHEHIREKIPYFWEKSTAKAHQNLHHLKKN